MYKCRDSRCNETATTSCLCLFNTEHQTSSKFSSKLVAQVKQEYIWTDLSCFNENVIDKRSSYCIVLFGNNRHTITTRQQ